MAPRVSSRAFTVFVDQPLRPILKSTESQAVSPVTTTAGGEAQKENLHPVTGETPSGLSEPAAKKRKSTVLVTKSYIPPTPAASKKGKASAAEGSSASTVEPRKRASASSHEGKLVSKKPRRLVVATKLRAVEELPKVEETPETDIPTSQAAATTAGTSSEIATADRTVQAPENNDLVDDELVRALEQVSLEPELPNIVQRPTSEPSTTQPVRSLDEQAAALPEASPRSELIAQSDVQPAVAKSIAYSFQAVSGKKSRKKVSSGKNTKKSPGAAKDGKAAFSTPERKLIYSAFTFATPSPTSQRFTSAAPPSNIEVPRFGDARFSFTF